MAASASAASDDMAALSVDSSPRAEIDPAMPTALTEAQAAVEKQGALVKSLKAAEKKDKAAIDAEVSVLQAHKARLSFVQAYQAYIASPKAVAACPPGMTPAIRYKQMVSIGSECISKIELLELLEREAHPICYDGFEPSGRMHIAQGVLKALNVNKLTSAGCTFVFWVADWFAQLNNKMGGDLDNIRTVGKYFIEVWKACNMDMSNVKFLWASEEINKRPDEYWMTVMDIARRNNLKRIIRCSTIMGREESFDLSAAQIFYPCMQCADIFFLKADICQLGMDQRKVNMLAREYCDQMGRKIKPIILSHHMMPGIKEGQAKMSKSDPDSAIFMEDTEKDVERKIGKSFCPPNSVQDNPCVAYVRHMILPKLGEIVITLEGDAGTRTYRESEIDKFEEDYMNGLIFPGVLKKVLVVALNKILQPVRDHFATGEAKELLEKVKVLRQSK